VTNKIVQQPGPVLSRFDRLLLIGPWAKGGPALRLLTNANFRFISKLLVYSSGAGPSVLGALTDLTGSQMFSNDFPKKSINSLYYHHHTTRKPCFRIILVFR